MRIFKRAVRTCLIAFSGLFLFSANQYAQKEAGKQIIKIGGFVRHEVIYDSYKIVDFREGEVILYPMKERLDEMGNDINEVDQIEMFALQSRVNVKVEGIEALGAKAMGVIEGDFFGNTNSNMNTLRLRHAYFSLNWDKSALLFGQYWHPMFVPECFPQVLSFGAGVPFHPLSRAPQVRLTYNLTDPLSVAGIMLIHSPFRSQGPADAQRNAGIPDMQFQLKYKTRNFLLGATAGYKVLQPRIVTENNLKTDESIGSYNLQGFLKIKANKLVAKIESMYGTNFSNFIMPGGFGTNADPALVDDYGYTNLTTMSTWGEVIYDFDHLSLALFVGHIENLGPTDTYYSLGYAWGEDLKSTTRISPRIAYTKDKVQFGLEYMMTNAVYHNLAVGEYTVISTDDPVVNHRILFSTAYFF